MLDVLGLNSSIHNLYITEDAARIHSPTFSWGGGGENSAPFQGCAVNGAHWEAPGKSDGRVGPEIFVCTFERGDYRCASGGADGAPTSDRKDMTGCPVLIV